MGRDQVACDHCSEGDRRIALGDGDCNRCVALKRERRLRELGAVPGRDELGIKAFEEVGRLAAYNEKLREALKKFEYGTPIVIPHGVTVERRSILQDWVMGLGLRHQGVLLTVIRGCDTAPKHDPSKLLTRCIREAILNPHCGDSRKAATFIEWVDDRTLMARCDGFAKNLDHYPHHYVMHVIHAIEIIGYKHPSEEVRCRWLTFYYRLVRGLHMNEETEAQLDQRLDADEETFAARDGGTR
jgi:hypothetical protein